MANTRITINGQQYDSPDEMPPDVRRTYEEAMKTMSSLSTGPRGGTTQVYTGHAGPHLGGSLLVTRTLTVNNRTYGGLDELPPDVRQQVEGALGGAGTQVRPKTTVGLTFNIKGPQVQGLGRAGEPPMPPAPIDPSSTEGKIRSLPMTVAFFVGIALVLWLMLARN